MGSNPMFFEYREERMKEFLEKATSCVGGRFLVHRLGLVVKALHIIAAVKIRLAAAERRVWIKG